MDRRGSSLAKIQEVPRDSLTLLVGPPGAGKSTFCHHAVLDGIASERPVIFVTTERSPSGVTELLKERGIGEPPPGALSFVDAFTETVGLTCTQRSDTVCANCADLNSLSMATTKMQERIGQKGILLAFDSLTSPYLFCGAEVTKFIRLFLARFAAQGNSVVALIDEGCGKSEDLVAMMSIADGVIKIETQKDKQLFEVVKHPKLAPTRIEVPAETEATAGFAVQYDPSVLRQFVHSMFGQEEAAIRREMGDFVNSFWPNLAHWSGMLWDPQRFPTMIYDLNRRDQEGYEEFGLAELLKFFPWRMRLLFRAVFASQALGLFPKNFSRVKDMKKLSRMGGAYIRAAKMERCGIIEYLEDISRTDEHYFRVYESSDCCGFENVGATIASHLPPAIAGQVKTFEKWERDWNAIETKCVGLGDPYCEFKLVPGEIDELRDSLKKDSSVVERIHQRLMERLMGFLLDEKPLPERPRLGCDVQLHVVCHAMGFPHLGERYRMAQRMGGAKSGRDVGERLIKAGIKEDEAIKRVINFMNFCKVGKVTVGETIKIRENCESIRTKLFTTIKEPSCFFTTGFLNGLFSVVRNQHVRETKCIVAGDPYCEWEII
jgi:predicted hydrocarbon binding protein/KaiC/GvpD/RAD55 family RecA-like ATPase